MNFERLLKFGDPSKNFASLIGLEVLEVSEGYAKGKIELQPMHGNPIGSVHGGVLFTLADNVGGIAATTRGVVVTTLDSTINYLNPAINSKTLYATAHEVKAGKKIMVYDVEIVDDNDVVIATTRFTYYRFKPLPEDFFE